MTDISDILFSPCFALYRMPNKGVVYGLAAKAAKTMSGGFERGVGRAGFFIAPFDSARGKSVFIPAEQRMHCYSARLPRLPLWLSGYEINDRTRYMEDFAAVKAAIDSGGAMKVVLARRVRVRIAAHTMQVLNIFGAACKMYPHNYIALWHTPQTGTWLTATPELLLSADSDGKCRTTALAGTMSATEPGADSLSGWSEKNLEEQRLVQQHIFHVLADTGVPYKVSRLAITPSGKLFHLRTDFTFPAPHSVGLLLDWLHPTPAVCGMPVRSARRVLSGAEHINRDYYAGYSGPTFDNGSFAFYVTLRCMHVFEQGCDLFAGSGILRQSTAEDEWEETERKLNALRDLMPLRG